MEGTGLNREKIQIVMNGDSIGLNLLLTGGRESMVGCVGQPARRISP